jgi:DNA-binding transcriptional ArsR family regulator
MTQPVSLFAALADPTRQAILDSLRGGGQTAGSIAASYDVSWPAISRHLKILKAASLVWETREGRTRYYELNPDAFRTAMSWLLRFQPQAGRSSPVAPPGPSMVGREYTS